MDWLAWPQATGIKEAARSCSVLAEATKAIRRTLQEGEEIRAECLSVFGFDPFQQVQDDVLAGAASAALGAASAGHKKKATRTGKLISSSDQEGKAPRPGSGDAATAARRNVEAAAAPAVDLAGSSDEEDAMPLAKRRRKLLAQAAPRAAKPPASAGAGAASGGEGKPQPSDDVIDLLDSSSDESSSSEGEEESSSGSEGGNGSGRRGAGGKPATAAPAAESGGARRPEVPPPRSPSPEVFIESITQAPPKAAAAAAPRQAPAQAQHLGRAPAEQGPQAGIPASEVGADGQASPVKKPRRKPGTSAAAVERRVREAMRVAATPRGRAAEVQRDKDAWEKVAQAWRNKHTPSLEELQKAAVSSAEAAAAARAAAAAARGGGVFGGAPAARSEAAEAASIRAAAELLSPPEGSTDEGEWRSYYRQVNQARVAGVKSFAKVLRTFGVPCADQADLKPAYHRAARMYHPDSNCPTRVWGAGPGGAWSKLEAEEVLKIINERRTLA